LHIEANEQPIIVGQIAEDLPDRFRQPAHQRGHGENLVARGKLRCLQQIDDLDAILIGEVRLTDALEIRKRDD